MGDGMMGDGMTGDGIDRPGTHHCFAINNKHQQKLERVMGLEPTTPSLEGWCSTIELHPQ
jgi:hypothetical protein